jgi:hypothetical protein
MKAPGWNQTEEDWRNLLALEPEGCFAIEREGKVVATAIGHPLTPAWGIATRDQPSAGGVIPRKAL